VYSGSGPRPLRQPGLYFGVLVGAVVVDDQVQIELLGLLILDPPQEAQELLLPMPMLAFGDHRIGDHIQVCKQGGGAGADVVVDDVLHIPQAHGQQRLRPV
jgi:hypothetical protein